MDWTVLVAISAGSLAKINADVAKIGQTCMATLLGAGLGTGRGNKRAKPSLLGKMLIQRAPGGRADGLNVVPPTSTISTQIGRRVPLITECSILSCQFPTALPPCSKGSNSATLSKARNVQDEESREEEGSQEDLHVNSDTRIL